MGRMAVNKILIIPPQGRKAVMYGLYGGKKNFN
jgi:hypothetical protein